MQATHKSLSLSPEMIYLRTCLPAATTAGLAFPVVCLSCHVHGISQNRKKLSKGKPMLKKIKSSTNSSEVFSDDVTISTTTAEEDLSCTRPEQQQESSKKSPTNAIATTTTVVNTGEEEEDQQHPIYQREIRNRFHNTGNNSSSKKVSYRIGYKRCCLRVGRMRGEVAADGFLVYKNDQA